MYIKLLKIENLRSLATVELPLNTPSTQRLKFPNVNVMLGDNGVGKTSVLRAAALAALGPLLSASSGYVPDSLIRRPPGMKGKRALENLPPAFIEADVALEAGDFDKGGDLKLTDGLRLRTTVEALGTRERLQWKCIPARAAKAVESMQFDERATAFFVVGYGATRRVEGSTRVDESARAKSRLRRYERVSSLFEEHLALMPLSYWLPAYAERNKGRYSQVVKLMNALLPIACRMEESATETREGMEHLFSMNGVTVPFRALSDGYRAYIGWIGDMLFHVCMGAGTGVKLRDMRGVVLIDEIDLHLHPEWQRVVVPTLSQALPHVQFIVTTHSPLVVGSLEAGNLFLLTEENGATKVSRLPERVHGKSAEQILLSPYFGLESTRAQDVADKLKTLANRASEGDRTASAEYLEILSGGLAAKDVASVASTPSKRASKATTKGSAASKRVAKSAKSSS